MSGGALPRVGIVGAGRLGRALGGRLRPGAQVVFSDLDPRRAKQAAKQTGAASAPEREVLDGAEYLLVCIPPDQVPGFFRRAEAASAAGPLYLNTATDVDTPALVRELGLRRCRVMGLKPVGQFAAIARGVPVTFVTAHTDPGDLARVRRLFAPLGPVQVGDERGVGALNRLATRLALRFCLELPAQLAAAGSDPAWAVPALRGVVAGTLLDYPPDPENAYTARLLDELAAAAPSLEPAGA